MNDTLQRSVQTLDEQFQIVDGAVAQAQTSGAFLAAALAAAVLVVTLFMALLQANGFARSIIAIGRHIALLKQGDLTSRTRETRRDEIGTLAADLNDFGVSLAQAVGQIREVSEANLSRKNALTESAGDATASVTQIAANARSIETQVQALHSRIQNASGLVTSIVADLSGLNDRLGEHQRLNGDSTSSVTQMIRSLEDLRTSASAGQERITDLREAAQRGSEVFSEASRKMDEVPRQVQGITEMAAVIGAISAQTNLLAMNAAIEAAHAGDAGRGFAVVADEIRKLAEESAGSSQRIRQSIRNVITMITEAAGSNRETVTAFENVSARIAEVSDSLGSMFGALAAIQEGGETVLASLTQANAAAEGVAAGTSSVDRSTQAIREVMTEVGRVSDEVAANIAEITVGVSVLNETFHHVAELTASVGEGSVTLDREVQRFKFT
jgi:methyl-accepting chemotaxis protein